MKRSPFSAEDLLREMRSSVIPVSPPDGARTLREETIGHLRATQVALRLERNRARSSRRRTLLGAGVLFPAAAAAATLYVVRHDRVNEARLAGVPAVHVRALAGHVGVVHAGHSAEAAVGVDTLLESGDGIRTGNESRAEITLPSGAAVQADVATDVGVSVPDASERIELSVGRVDLSVPKLAPGRSLFVHTPNALVTVHGTRFTVTVVRTQDDSLETRVAVTEGIVAVERDGRTVELPAGGSWSSSDAAPLQGGGLAPGAAGPTAPLPDSSENAVARHGAQRILEYRARLATVSDHASNGGSARVHGNAPAETSEARFGDASGSTLPEENRLMERAMVSSRNGDDSGALKLLDTLLARFPRSVLKENAQVERFRALRRLGQVSEASHEARRYLAEHPNGMERDEAKRLAVEATASPGGTAR